MPTWTITQCLYQECQAGGDSRRENLCQQDSERVNKTTPGASLGRPIVTEGPSCRKKVHLHPNTEREKYIRKLDDPAKNSKPQSGDEDEFYNQILNSTCAKCGCDLGLHTSSSLWASSWLTKEHEDFKRMVMKRGFPRTQNLTRVQRLTLLSGPAAKLIRIKVHVFSDSTMCVAVSSPDPSNKWATNWRMNGMNMDLSKNGILQPEKCDSCGTYFQVLLPFKSTKHIQEYRH